MPTPLLRAFSKKSDTSINKVDAIWDEVKADVKKRYAKLSDDRQYALINSIVQKRLKINEGDMNEDIKNNSIIKKLSKHSGKSADDVIKHVSTSNSDIKKSKMKAKGLKKLGWDSYVAPNGDVYDWKDNDFVLNHKVNESVDVLDKINEFLNEDSNPKIKTAIQKAHGLKHVNFNNYKDKQGNSWFWDDEKNNFIKQSAEQNMKFDGNDGSVRGMFHGYKIVAKIFDKPSHNGIDEGRISKLLIKDTSGKEVYNYDRGLDFDRATTGLAKEVVAALEAQFKPKTDDE